MGTQATTTAEPRIELTMSGAFSVLDPEGREIAGLSRRGQGLLAYLATRPGMRAERAALADLLWSDRAPEQARASLRQELSTLRRALPEGVLEATRQHVRLDPGRVVARGGSAPPLEGFDLASEGFEDWLRELRQSAGQPAAADPAAIFERPAVLLFAFEALSGTPEDRMIATGLSDDLRTTLCYWRWFPVIGPDAIGWKTAKDCDLREVAAGVGAAYAVSGSLGHIGERVRISVVLADARSGRSIWSSNLDGRLDDIFAFQDEASRAIVAQIEPQIAAAEATRLVRSRPADIAPWQLLAMADEVDRRAPEGYGTYESNLEQDRLMRRALETAPDFAAAHARRARIWFRIALMDWSDDREAAFHAAIRHSDRALELDPRNWEAHAYSGLARLFGNRERETCIFHGREAVSLNPSAALARHALACGLEWTGEIEESLAQLRLIFRLNPAYSGRAAALGQLATCEMFQGNREAALEAAHRLMAIAPNYARGLQRCVAIFGWFDETDDAAAAAARLRELHPGFSEDYVRDTYPYARPEHSEMLREGLRRAGALGQ